MRGTRAERGAVKFPEMPGGYRPGDVVNGHILTERGHWIPVDDPVALANHGVQLPGRPAAPARPEPTFDPTLSTRSDRRSRESVWKATLSGPAAPVTEPAAPVTQPAAPATEAAAPAKPASPYAAPAQEGGKESSQSSASLRGCLVGCLVVLLVLAVFGAVVAGIVRAVSEQVDLGPDSSHDVEEITDLEVVEWTTVRDRFSSYWVAVVASGAVEGRAAARADVILTDSTGEEHEVTDFFEVTGEDGGVMVGYLGEPELEVVDLSATFELVHWSEELPDYRVELTDWHVTHDDGWTQLEVTLTGTGEDHPEPSGLYGAHVLALARDATGDVVNVARGYLEAPELGESVTETLPLFTSNEVDDVDWEFRVTSY